MEHRFNANGDLFGRENQRLDRAYDRLDPVGMHGIRGFGIELLFSDNAPL